MASTDTLGPFRGYAFRLGPFPLLDSDGDLVTGAAGLDSEVSKDFGTYADCTNEAAEVATNSGTYSLDLTATEMAAACVAVITKTSTAGAKTTPMVLWPQKLLPVESDTAQAGAAGTITLASGASGDDDALIGMYVGIVSGTGAGQVRLITDYVGSTKVVSVTPNWGTNPNSTSVYELCVGPATNVGVWAGTRIGALHTAGYPVVTVKDGTGTGEINTASGEVVAASVTGDVGGDVTGSIGSLAAQAKADVNAEVDTAFADYDGPTHAELVAEIDAVQTDIAGLNDPDAGTIALAVWDALTADLDEPDSIGRLLVDRFDAAISSRSTVTTAQVNAEVVDVLRTDQLAELAQAKPSATPTFAAAVMLLYMALRNELTQTEDTLSIRDDAGTVIAKATTSDDGTTFSRSELVSGA